MANRMYKYNRNRIHFETVFKAMLKITSNLNGIACLYIRKANWDSYYKYDDFHKRVSAVLDEYIDWYYDIPFETRKYEDLRVLCTEKALDCMNKTGVDIAVETLISFCIARNLI